MRPRTAFVPSMLALALGSGAVAQCVTRFEMLASPGDAMSLAIAMPLAGTFIGNYDAVSNPTGTRTIPGLFGGSGNNPIAFTSVLKPAVTLAFPQGVPVLTFCVDTLAPGPATVTCASLDLLGASTAPITINLTISYPNFHTVAPSAIFPGVSNLTLPLPAGEISDASAVQTAAAVGAIVPGTGGTLVLTAAIPMDLTFTAVVLGQKIGGAPTPILLPIVAEFVPTIGGAYAVASIEIPETVEPIPAPTTGLVDQPFDLPTVLPPGGTAHLLVTGTFAEGTLTYSLSAALSGPGVPVPPTGDLNADCIVNGADLGILIGNWGGGPGPADLNGDGVVNGADLGILIGHWTM